MKRTGEITSKQVGVRARQRERERRRERERGRERRRERKGDRGGDRGRRVVILVKTDFRINPRASRVKAFCSTPSDKSEIASKAPLNILSG